MGNEKPSGYKIAFKFISAVNLVMLMFLFEFVVGQNSPIPLRNQTSIVARVIPQIDSPLQITISGIDNSQKTFQSIFFSVRNTSNQPIRAFTILGEHLNTYSFGAKLLLPGESFEDSMEIERIAIKEGKMAVFEVDYVEFANGAAWGRDSARKSKQIKAERMGRVFAIRFLKDILRRGNTIAIGDILNQEISRMAVPKPPQTLDKEEEKGLQLGFKSIVSILKKNTDKSPESLSRKLEELELVNQ